MCGTITEMLGRFFMVFVAHLALAIVALASDSARKTHETQPSAPRLDPTVQTAIRGLLSTNANEMFSGTEEAFRERLNRVRKLAGGDAELVLQLVYFSSHARNMREAMIPGVIIEQLKIPKTTITTAVLRLLEAKDKATREEAANWLAEADKSSSGKGADFGRYTTLLREGQPSHHLGLIGYMYERDPHAALLTLANVYGNKATHAAITAKLMMCWKSTLTVPNGAISKLC